MGDDIDRAIDEVARELTAGEPDGAFRARVLARIDAGETRPRRWAGAWVVSPIAAALVVAVAAIVMFERGGDHRAQQTAQQAAANPAATVTPAVRLTDSAKATSVKNPDTTDRASAAAELPRPRGAVRLKADTTYGSEVDALAPPPLKVPSIALAPIDRGDSIRLQQLEQIAPIDVAPLSPEPPNREPWIVKEPA